MDDLPELPTSEYWILISVIGGTIFILVILSAVWITYRNKMLYKKDCRQDEPTVKDFREAGAIELTEHDSQVGDGQEDIYNFESS